MEGHKSLRVYQLAYELAMEIFHISKTFPAEERYSLSDQIRRSSRAVAANIAEGYRKRQYPRMFVSSQTRMGRQRKPKPGSTSRWIASTFRV
jgi:hypothetical protein